MSIGRRLIGFRRKVLGLGRFNSESGHGMAELVFDQLRLILKTGPNEDFIVVEQGPLDDLDSKLFEVLATD